MSGIWRTSSHWKRQWNKAKHVCYTRVMSEAGEHVIEWRHASYLRWHRQSFRFLCHVYNIPRIAFAPVNFKIPICKIAWQTTKAWAEECRLKEVLFYFDFPLKNMKSYVLTTWVTHTLRLINSVADTTKPYGDLTINKEECIGYVQKRMSNRLRTMTQIIYKHQRAYQRMCGRIASNVILLIVKWLNHTPLKHKTLKPLPSCSWYSCTVNKMYLL